MSARTVATITAEITEREAARDALTEALRDLRRELRAAAKAERAALAAKLGEALLSAGDDEDSWQLAAAEAFQSHKKSGTPDASETPVGDGDSGQDRGELSAGERGYDA